MIIRGGLVWRLPSRVIQILTLRYSVWKDYISSTPSSRCERSQVNFVWVTWSRTVRVKGAA
jgi:hypothetical protein